ALRLWLALQQTPSRSPRACSQKIGLFSFLASALASASDENQWISSVNLATFLSTTPLGTTAPTSFFSTPPVGLMAFCAAAHAASVRVSTRLAISFLNMNQCLRVYLPLVWFFFCFLPGLADASCALR